MLDSLKKAEIQRQSRALIHGLDIKNPNNATNEEKARAQRFKIMAKHTVLDAIFGGQLLSFIHCTVCNYRSFTFEQFMDLSLSVNLNAINIPSQNMSNLKKDNVATVSPFVKKNMARKDNKKKQVSHNIKCDIESEDEPLAMNSILDDDKEDVLNNKNLTLKERKQRRAQRKATRREAKKNKEARDKAQREQNIEERTELADNSVISVSKVDNNEKITGDQENQTVENENELTKKNTENESTILKSYLEDSNFNIDFVSQTSKEENFTENSQNNSLIAQISISSQNSTVLNSDSNCVLHNDHKQGFLFTNETQECLDLKCPSPLFSTQFYVQKLSDSDSGCGNDDDELDEGIDMVENHSLPFPEPSSDHQSAGSDNDKKSFSINGDSDSGQDVICNNLLKNDREKDIVLESNFDPNVKPNTNNSPDPSLLSHIKPEYRSKFYDLVMQKLYYCNQNSSKFDNCDLGTLFESFIKPEILDNANKYLCENCSLRNGGIKTYSKAHRCQMIALPPPVLVIHLKRFETTGCRGRSGFASMQKLNTCVSFPERLNLSPYTSKIYESFAKFYEPDNDLYDSVNQLEYQLYGVVIHSGSLRSGHYMAYVCVRPDEFYTNRINRFLHFKPFVSNIEHILSVCYEKEFQNDQLKQKEDNDDKTTASNEDTKTKNPTEEEECELKKTFSSLNRKWYFISDSSVSPTNLNNVLQDTRSPYLLFYERIF